MKPTSTDIRLAWFLLNLKVGALSFGGSGRLLMYQDAVVDEHKWLSNEEFQEIFTVIQVLPGPNLVNLCVYLGYKLVGPFQTFLSLLALATPGTILAVFVLAIVNFSNFHVAQLFQGLSIGSVALFAIFIWRLRNGILEKNISILKTALRFAIVLVVMFSIFTAVPLHLVLLGALPTCLAVEFLT